MAVVRMFVVCVEQLGTEIYFSLILYNLCKARPVRCQEAHHKS
jgi:hypothetical protein